MSALRNQLFQAVSEKELVTMLMDMVRIPSYHGIKNQETEVARYIKQVFDCEGIDCQLTEVEDGRCNVTATLKGTGGGKTLLFNGHTDTVAPNDMERALDPFIENGCVYGRGTSDMKGPLVSMMAALIGIKRLNLTLKGDLVFTGVLDEEHQSIGTIDLIEKGIKADGAIVGEPTELNVCTAHRGLEWYQFHFIGKTVHGGKQKEGINAIAKCVKFINAMDETLIPMVNARTHPLLEQATLNYGVIHGGTQLSTVAGDCKLWVDRRILPGEEYQQVEAEFKGLIDRLAMEDPQFKCHMSVTDDSLMKPGYIHPPMEIDPEHPLVQTTVTHLTQVLGQPPLKTFFPAWTDGALLSQYAGIPTLVMGPGFIEACHSKDEHIAIDHLVKGYASYALIALDFCNKD